MVSSGERAPATAKSPPRLAEGPLKPEAPVRRYDVLAAWNYVAALDEGKPDSKARQYGIWMATVVAARKFRRQAEARGTAKPLPEKEEKRTDFLGLTARDYEGRIRKRMGAEFHDGVFLPAVRRGRTQGHAYVEIRDSIREDWKP